MLRNAKVEQYIFLSVVLFSANALADVCPAKDEAIVTTPYKWSTTCPATTIIIEGDRNPEKYETCLGDVSSAREQVFYQAKGKKPLPLPTVNSLLPPDASDSFKLSLWIAGANLEFGNPYVKCDGKNAVSIGFSKGGNCTGCERTVKYTFDNNGELKRAELK